MALFCYALCIFPGFPSSARQAEAAGQPPTFRSSARVVLIEVLVTDRAGNPVLGLTRDDFSLTDDGHKQKLTGFEEHNPGIPAAVLPPFPPRPDSHTNWAAAPSSGAANIVLVDLLNTSPSDRMFARQQLLKFLRHLPPADAVALFTLGTQLHLAQDFTSNQDLLLAALEKSFSATGLLGGMKSPTDLVDLDLGGPVSFGNEPEIRFDVLTLRKQYTLDAFRDLARATASFPGRKNVIWLTSGFPVSDKKNTDMTSDVKELNRQHNFAEEVRRAATGLATAHLAIYPVDVRALVDGVNPSGDWPTSLPCASRNPANCKQKPYDPMRPPLQIWAERETMNILAQETGGRGYYDRNDLDAGMARVLNTYSNYYTLAYTPRDIKWDGSYHQVNVKLAGKNVDLSHRRGYYALGESPLTSQQASAALGEALGLDLIDSRMIVLAAQVAQPQGPGQPIRIHCSIDPNTVSMDSTADGNKSALLGIGATAWNVERHRAGEVAKKVDIVLHPDQLSKVTTSGIPWTLDMALDPGAYTLKVAVVDLNSGKTGSLTVPLKVEVQSRITAPEPVRADASTAAVTGAPPKIVPLPKDSPATIDPVVPFDPNAAAISDYCRNLAGGNERFEALKSVCEFSLSAQRRLPNYICNEKLKRWATKTLPETVEAQVAFQDGRQTYSNIRIDGKPASTTVSDRFPNLAPTGEFGSQLLQLFAPENKARFKFKKEVTLNSRTALLFSFNIKEETNRSFKIWDIDGNKTHPGYSGSMWVDASTLRLLRLEMTSNPLQYQRGALLYITFQTDYRDVSLPDASTFLLPFKATVHACLNSAYCFHNELEFSNWHAFRAKGRILDP